MKVKDIFYTLVFSFFISTLKAQEGDSKLAIKGYLSGMPQMSWNTLRFDTLSQFERADHYLLHNRLNFDWYPSDKLTGTIQFRNQLMYGDFTKEQNFENGFHTENYFLPFTYFYNYGDAGLLSISTDRVWLQYTHNDLEVKVGRQRINWGQTFVWNPNDIFNAYNFFDFDYAERPGADAIRTIYYPNYTSTIEIAAKLDSAANLTAAALYRFNKSGFDFQFISGYYSQPAINAITNEDIDADWIGGAGITGDYKGVSLRTEATYMYPTNESRNEKEYFLWSVGLDYSFQNQLYISGEFFYSNNVELNLGSDINSLNNSSLTVKNLAFAKYNGFAQLSYPITPIFKTTLSGMVFSDEKMTGFFFGPYLDYSIMDNLDLALYFQFFKFNYKTLFGEIESQTSYAFLRLKWNF